MSNSGSSGIKIVVDIVHAGIAVARAFAGDFTGLVVQAFKWGKVIIGIIVSVIALILLVLLLVVCLPLLLLQSLTPNSGGNADALLNYANTELVALDNTRNSVHGEAQEWMAGSIFDFWGEDDEGKSVNQSSELHINEQEVLEPVLNKFPIFSIYSA